MSRSASSIATWTCAARRLLSNDEYPAIPMTVSRAAGDSVHLGWAWIGRAYAHYLEGRADPPLPPEVVAASERVLAASEAARPAAEEMARIKQHMH